MSLCLVKNANITTPIADNLLRCFVKDYNIIHSVECVKAFTDAYDVLLEMKEITIDSSTIIVSSSLNNYNGKAGIKRGSSSTEWGIYVVSGYLSTLEIEHTSDTVEYILRLY